MNLLAGAAAAQLVDGVSSVPSSLALGPRESAQSAGSPAPTLIRRPGGQLLVAGRGRRRRPRRGGAG